MEKTLTLTSSLDFQGRDRFVYNSLMKLWNSPARPSDELFVHVCHQIILHELESMNINYEGDITPNDIEDNFDQNIIWRFGWEGQDVLNNEYNGNVLNLLRDQYICIMEMAPCVYIMNVERMCQDQILD